MTGIEFDSEAIADWFKDEVSGLFISLVTSIAAILEGVDTEIEQLKNISAFDESFIDRSIRDIQSCGYDKIVQALVDLV